jgi:hypothetical protein
MTSVDVAAKHIEIFKRDLRTSEDVKLVEGDMIERDRKGCANQYITSILNIPIAPYKINNTPLIVKVTGTEGQSENFQRIQMYFPEPIKCQNGAVFDDYGYCR